MTENIDEYIKSKRSEGVNDLIIRDNLLDVGWNKRLVNLALVNNETPPSPKDKQKGNLGLWDAFQHILFFISMYVLVITLILAINLIVDKIAPDLAYDSWRYDYASDSMKGYIASIIVTLPLFTLFLISIKKRTSNFPEIKTLRVRKILIYLTLVVTFITAIITITSLIYSVLDGSVSLNSLLKIINILFLNSVVFVYLLNLVRDDRQTKN